MAKCVECNRVFDMNTEVGYQEYYFGHDCEVI